jgi:hypothetical protein
MRYLLAMCRDSGSAIGLHASYEAGFSSTLVADEKKTLEDAVGQVSYNRHHFLCSREPEDMQALEQAGITDDFTMGYADAAGFRLGTCRATNWINPADKSVHPLQLHPLTVMECTLDRPTYMNMDYADAETYCKKLIDKSEYFGGEVTLLWHNTSFTGASWYAQLYESLTEYLA